MNLRRIVNLKVKLFLVLLILFLNLELSFADSEDLNTLNTLEREALIYSSDVGKSVNIVGTYVPNDAKKDNVYYIIHNSLKGELDSISQSKLDLDNYKEYGDYASVKKTIENINYRTDKIYAYTCMLQLEDIVQRSKKLRLNLKIRTELHNSERLDSLLESANSIIPSDKRIKIDPNSNKISFRSYKDYKNICEENYNLLLNEFNSLKKDYNPYKLGGWGWLLSSLTAGLLIYIFSFILFEKKGFDIPDKKIHDIQKYLTALFGGLWGFWVIPAENWYWRITGGIIAGFIMFSILEGALKKLKELFFSEDVGTPIEELNIKEEYKQLLKDSDYEFIEDLVKEDLKTLSKDTGLLIETLVDLSEKAKKYLDREGIKTKKRKKSDPKMKREVKFEE